MHRSAGGWANSGFQLDTYSGLIAFSNSFQCSSSQLNSCVAASMPTFNAGSLVLFPRWSTSACRVPITLPILLVADLSSFQFPPVKSSATTRITASATTAGHPPAEPCARSSSRTRSASPATRTSTATVRPPVRRRSATRTERSLCKSTSVLVRAAQRRHGIGADDPA
jgi:hypothetical protein